MPSSKHISSICELRFWEEKTKKFLKTLLILKLEEQRLEVAINMCSQSYRDEGEMVTTVSVLSESSFLARGMMT